MEWGRVKSIMIGVFCIVNIFLLSSYVGTMKTSVNVSEDTIQNTVIILAQNNITVNDAIIPRKTHDIRTFEVVNKFDTPEKAAEYFWSISKKEKTDYFNPQYTQTTKNSFEYKNKIEMAEIINVNAAHAHSKKIVTRLGLDSGMNVDSHVQKNGVNYTVTFNQVYEGNNVLDTVLVFEYSENSTIRIYGENWLCDSVSDGGIATIRAVTEILVNFAVSIEHEKPAVLTEIKLGYFIGDRGGEKSTVWVAPVWRLTTEDGKKYYYDAINGDFL